MKRIGAVCIAVLVGGCVSDLQLPEPPTRASLRGTVDTGGHIPAGGHELQLSRLSDGDRFTQTTDDDGSFAFPDLLPGVYNLNVALPGFAPLPAGPFVLRGADEDAGVLRPAWLAQTPSEAFLTGKVVVAGGSATVDGGARPSDALGAKLKFTLDGTGTVISEATVDAYGDFSARLPPGTYSLQAQHPFYVSATRSGVTLDPGSRVDLSAEPLVLALNPAELRGRVLREGGGAAEGALVTSDTGLTATTDSDGRFALGGLAAGARSFTLTFPDFHDALGAHAVQLSPGAMTDVGDLTLLMNRGDITGTVQLGDGAALAQVSVEVSGTTITTQAVADTTQPDQGHFKLSGVPVGTYSVRASKQGYAAASSPSVTVVYNQSVDTGLLRLTRVSGDFLIDDGDDTNTPGYARTTSVTLRVTNSANAFQYRAAEGEDVSAAAWQPFSTNISFTLSSGDGAKRVALQLKDTQGSEGPVLTADVTLDSTAPSNATLVIASGADFANALLLPVTVTAQETGSGLSGLFLSSTPSPDGGVLPAPRRSYLRDGDFQLSAASVDGPQTVYAQVVDHAGNASAVAQDTVVIDRVAPDGLVTISASPGAQTGFTNSPQVTLNVTSSPEPSGGFVKMKLSNTLTTLGSATQQDADPVVGWFLNAQGEGLKTVHYRFVDAAGNESSVQQASITWDATKPLVTVTRLSASPTNALVVDFSVAATESNPLSPTRGLVVSESAAFTNADASAFPGSGLKTFTLSSGDGLRAIYVRVTDAAGNEGDASLSLTLDQTPPLGVSLSLLGRLGDNTTSTDATSTTTITPQLAAGDATQVIYGTGTPPASCPTSGYAALPGSVPTLSPATAPQQQTVWACVRDGAGNTSGPVSDSLLVDTSAPSGCALALTGFRADGTSSGVAKTALRDVGISTTSCGEAPAEVALQSAPTACTAGTAASLTWLPLGSGLTWQLPAGDGSKTVYGCVRDGHRNVGGLTSAALTLDTTSPTGVAISVASGAEYLNTATWNAGAVSVTGAATGAVEWALSASGSPTSFNAFNAGTPGSVTLSAQGRNTVYALFRDDVGNTSPLATDDVTVDTVAPTTTTLTLRSPTNNAFTNTQVVTANLGATDAARVKLQEVGGAAACPASYSASEQTAVASYTFALTPGDGLKKVCAQLIDAAGNTTSGLSATITLDTTPPTTPQIINSNETRALANNAAYAVTIASASVDTNGVSYEATGGQLTSWQAITPSGLNFTFSIYNPNAASVEAGYRNELKLRARDPAGNASAESAVFVTADTNAPNAPLLADGGSQSLNWELRNEWIDNATRAGTVYWPPSSSPDIAGYRVFYGALSTGLNGTYAAQGISPVSTIGTQTYLTLSELPGETPTWVRIAPVDFAGNVGPTSQVRSVQPGGDVVFDVLASVVLNNAPGVLYAYPARVAQDGAWAWVASIPFGSQGRCRSNCDVQLHSVDLRTLESPIDAALSRPILTPRGPVQRGVTLYASDSVLQTTSGQMVDLLVEGPWLILVGGTHVRIFSTVTPESPQLKADIDVSSAYPTYRFQMGQVKADKLVLAGSTWTSGGGVSGGFSAVLDLSKLSDSDGASFPTVADLAVSPLPGVTVYGMGLTRDQQVLSRYNNPTGLVVELATALDPVSAATPWDAGARALPNLESRAGRAVMSGDVLFGGSTDREFSTQNVSAARDGGAASAPTNSAYRSSAYGQSDVVGSQWFVPFATGSGVRVLDVDRTTNGAFATSGSFQLDGDSSGVKSWGNLLLVADMVSSPQSARLTVLRVGGTRQLSALASTNLGYVTGFDLRAGMLLTSDGPFDLLTPTPSAMGEYDSPAAGLNFKRHADFDDFSVFAEDTGLRVFDNTTLFARPTPAPTLNGYAATDFPGVLRVSGVAAWGNALVVAEVRADGIYLDVLDATAIRDGFAVTVFSGAPNRIKQLKIVDRPFTASDALTCLADVTISGNIAAVTIATSDARSDGGFLPSNELIGTNAYFVDLSPVIDPSASWTASAIQASVPNIPRARRAFVQGEYAYVMTFGGTNNVSIQSPNSILVVAHVPELTDGNPATTNHAPQTWRSPNTFSRGEDLAVYGPTLFMVTNSEAQIYDISTPLSPQLRSSYPLSLQPVGTPGGWWHSDRNGIAAGGSHLYIAAPTLLKLSLE